MTEREDFEKWYLDHVDDKLPTFEPTRDYYLDATVDDIWQAWKALSKSARLGGSQSARRSPKGAEMSDTPSNVCEHGHLRRKCPHCEIVELERELAAAKAERDEALANWGKLSDDLAFLKFADKDEILEMKRENDALRADAERMREGLAHMDRFLSGAVEVYDMDSTLRKELIGMRERARAAMASAAPASSPQS